MNDYLHTEISEALHLVDAAIEAANPPNPCSGAEMARGLSMASLYAISARDILAGLIEEGGR